MHKSTHSRLVLGVAMLALVGVASVVGAAAESSPSSQSAAKGLITGSDGYTYYYDDAGKMAKGQFVRTDANTVYYFSQNGRGIKQVFVVHNSHLIQFWNIGTTTCFLVIGDKEAMFIDGLFGMGHLRQLAALFTDRPVSLAITHGSVDHAGAGLAPKDFKAVYMNPLDDDRLVNFGKSPFRRFTNDVNESRPTAKVDYYDILSVADYLIWTPDVKYTPMKDGMTFDLGNSTIEAIWVPGHSPGCTSFLLKESRTLISGDCAGISTQVNVGTIEDYRKSVLKLIARRADFDRIFISHGPQIPQGTPAPLDLFDKILATCDALLKGTLRGVPVPPSTDKIYGGTSAYVATSMVLGREQSYGNIRYNPELVLNAQQ